MRSKRRRSVFIRATCFCLQLNAFFCFQRCRCREVRLHASCMTGFIDGLFPPLFVTECNCPVKKEKKKKRNLSSRSRVTTRVQQCFYSCFCLTWHTNSASLCSVALRSVIDSCQPLWMVNFKVLLTSCSISRIHSCIVIT